MFESHKNECFYNNVTNVELEIYHFKNYTFSELYFKDWERLANVPNLVTPEDRFVTFAGLSYSL